MPCRSLTGEMGLCWASIYILFVVIMHRLMVFHPFCLSLTFHLLAPKLPFAFCNSITKFVCESMEIINLNHWKQERKIKHFPVILSNRVMENRWLKPENWADWPSTILCFSQNISGLVNGWSFVNCKIMRIANTLGLKQMCTTRVALKLTCAIWQCSLYHTMYGLN